VANGNYLNTSSRHNVSTSYPFPLDFSTAPPYESHTMTGKERRYLRALAHRLSPVVIVGQRGLTDAVVRQVDGALNDHELIKVRLGSECRLGRDELGAALAERTGAELAGEVGRVLILYRPHPERPTIVLPDAAHEKPARNAACHSTSG
jgi:RNA-binding protein